MQQASSAPDIRNINFGQGDVAWANFATTSIATTSEQPLPAIHLAPANGLPAASYAEFIDTFRTSYRFSSMNPRGTWSAPPAINEKFAWQRHMDDLVAAIKTQYCAPIIGMGHSFGGTLMLMAAHQHPELFSKLIVIEPASTPNRITNLVFKLLPDSLKHHLFPFISGSHARQRIWQSKRAFFDNYRDHPTFKHLTNQAMSDYTEHGLVARQDGQFELLYHPHWESAIFRNVEYMWQHLKRVTQPTLVIKGEKSYLYKQHYFNRQAKRMPENVSAVTLPGTYHLIPHENPTQLHKLISHWLTEN